MLCTLFATSALAQAPNLSVVTIGNGVVIGSGPATIAPGVDVSNGFYETNNRGRQVQFGSAFDAHSAYMLLYGITASPQGESSLSAELELTLTSATPIDVDLRLRFRDGLPAERQAIDAVRQGRLEVVGYGSSTDITCTRPCALEFERVRIGATPLTLRLGIDLALPTLGQVSLGCEVEIQASSPVQTYGTTCAPQLVTSYSTPWGEPDVVDFVVYAPGSPSLYALLGTQQTSISLPGIPCPILTDFFFAAPLTVSPSGFTHLTLRLPPFDFNVQYAQIEGTNVTLSRGFAIGMIP